MKDYSGLIPHRLLAELKLFAEDNPDRLADMELVLEITKALVEKEWWFWVVFTESQIMNAAQSRKRALDMKTDSLVNEILSVTRLGSRKVR